MNCERKGFGHRASGIGKRGLLAATVLAVVSVGCGYGEVSPVTYEYAKALYSLSNRRAAERIDAVETQIAAAAEAGELPQREAGWLLDICGQCRNGDWDGAQAAARRMMSDQVK